MRQLVVDNYVITTPIIEIIQRLRLALTNGKLKDIRESGENLVVTCPHHAGGHESTPACNIYIGDDSRLEYGYFRCFVCEEQGSFVKFVSECFGSSEEFAKKWLIDNFGILAFNKIQMDEPISLAKTKLKKQQYTNFIDKKILEQYQNWCPYLAQRKLSRETCEKFSVKYDAYYRQIIFPCFDTKGNIIMLPKRAIDYKTFYLDKNIEKPVYCLDYIIKNDIKKAVITEGPFDCLTSYEYGVPAIATFGTISDSQIKQINKSPITVLYIMFDNDDAGRRFAEVLKKKITKRIIIKEPKFPANKKDINELTFEEFHNIIKNC